MRVARPQPALPTDGASRALRRATDVLPDAQAAAEALAEPGRIATLHRTALLDSPVDEAFERLTRLAARTIGTPIALVSLVDSDRQFFASSRGLPPDVGCARETPLSHSFCQHLLAGEPLVVADAREHALVRDNRAVPDLGVVAYAGMPLTLRTGKTLGSFCVIDTRPRSWTEEELGILRDLAAGAVTEIELRLALRDAIERSTRDPLTGLLNHRAFHERLAEAVTRPRGPLSLVLLDIDHFKRVNDGCGHHTGDVTLRLVARRIAAQVREGDALGRIGGEEFGWLLPDATGATAAAAAERARRAVADSPIEGAGAVTISAGVAELVPGEPPDSLHRRADTALYVAKRRGRNRIVAAPRLGDGTGSHEPPARPAAPVPAAGEHATLDRRGAFVWSTGARGALDR